MKKTTQQKGYSLVEVLVAITVLLIALVGPLTIAHSGLKRSVQSKDNTMAVFLAQEGIEAIVKLREDGALSAAAFNDGAQVWQNAFSQISSRCASACGVTINDDGTIPINNVYQCSGSNCVMKYSASARVPFKQGPSAPGADSAYTRQLQISVDGTASARVLSTVSWSGASPGSVTLESNVYNIYYEP